MRPPTYSIWSIAMHQPDVRQRARPLRHHSPPLRGRQDAHRRDRRPDHQEVSGLPLHQRRLGPAVEVPVPALDDDTRREHMRLHERPEGGPGPRPAGGAHHDVHDDELQRSEVGQGAGGHGEHQGEGVGTAAHGRGPRRARADVPEGHRHGQGALPSWVDGDARQGGRPDLG